MTHRTRYAIWFQCVLGRMAAILTVPLIICTLKLAGYRIRGLGEFRRNVRHMMKEHDGPWLICANHLTLIDSFILAYAMMPMHRYIFQYKKVPWNVPEHANFNTSFLVGLLCYLVKCIPIKRGGDRESVKCSIGKCLHMLQKGQNLMIFPEGTRSRSGRVSHDNCTYHVGRLLHKVPQARVMCIYMRGDGQYTYSRFPRFGETFTISARQFRPETELKGLRGQRDFARQIIDQLLEMENGYFDTRRQRRGRPQSAWGKRQKQRPAVYPQSANTR